MSRKRKSPESELARTLAVWEIELAVHEGRLAGVARYLEELAAKVGEHRSRISEERDALAERAEAVRRAAGRKKIKSQARSIAKEMLAERGLSPEEALEVVRMAGELLKEMGE